MTGTAAPSPPPQTLLDTMSNLAAFHREDEEFYSQAPLAQAVEVQAVARVLRALAGRWSKVAPAQHPLPSPYAGAEDLNPPGLVSESGVLFMEGEGEPPEISRIKGDLERLAADLDRTASWLSTAMEQAWKVVGSLAEYPVLAELLGERNRIVANDWQSAGVQRLVVKLLLRSLDLIARVDFSPQGLRSDMASPRRASAHLYSASELVDRAADLLCESAILVHENERRWRVFEASVRQIRTASQP